MYWVYILLSENKNRFYIGSTGNIDKRLKDHNQSKVRSTKAYKPWKLIYQEKFTDRTAARKRENYLKNNYQSRKEIFLKFNKAPSSSLA